jgi:hypothetical protein
MHVHLLGHIFRLQLFGTSVHEADVIILEQGESPTPSSDEMGGHPLPGKTNVSFYGSDPQHITSFPSSD